MIYHGFKVRYIIKQLERNKVNLKLTFKKILNELPVMGYNFSRIMEVFNNNDKNIKDLERLNKLAEDIGWNYTRIYISYYASYTNFNLLRYNSPYMIYLRQGYIGNWDIYKIINLKQL